MDHDRVVEQADQGATTILQVRRSRCHDDRAGPLAFGEIRRRPSGFIDYDFYFEAARHERALARKVAVRKLLGIFVALLRRVRTGPIPAGIVSVQRMPVRLHKTSVTRNSGDDNATARIHYRAA